MIMKLYSATVMVALYSEGNGLMPASLRTVVRESLAINCVLISALPFEQLPMQHMTTRPSYVRNEGRAPPRLSCMISLPDRLRRIHDLAPHT